jgi:hypothetical protein
MKSKEHSGDRMPIIHQLFDQAGKILSGGGTFSAVR